MPIAAVALVVNTSRIQPPITRTSQLANTALQVRDFSQARENQHIKGIAAGSCPAKYVSLPAHGNNDDIYRLKDVGHGNFHAVMEVLTAKIFRLTGLGCPVIELANGCNTLMRENAVDDPKSLFVASRRDVSFVDLGVFLLSAGGEREIVGSRVDQKSNYALQKERHSAALSVQKNIEQQHGHWWALTDPGIVADYQAADTQRFSALEALNSMLPAPLLREQEKHYLASLFIGNWDHLNCFMENFGYAESNGGLVGKTVDFGASGPLGFQGKAKENSHQLAMMQRPAALFSAPEMFREEGRTFSLFGDAMPASLTGIAELPYGYQSKTSVLELIKAETEGEGTLLETSTDVRLSTAIEMAYRIHLIPEDVIESIIASHWTEAPADFAVTREQIADILKARKESIVSRIGQARLGKWEVQNQEKAAHARSEIAEALGGLGFSERTINPLIRAEWP